MKALTEISFILMPNGNPYIDGELDHTPTDLDNVLIRAERNKKIQWAYQKTYNKEEATVLINELYEEYNDKAWSEKIRQANEEEKKREAHYRRSQEFDY